MLTWQVWYFQLHLVKKKFFVSSNEFIANNQLSFIHLSMNMNESIVSGIQSERFNDYRNKKTNCFNDIVEGRWACRILHHVYDGKYRFTNACAWQGCHISLFHPSLPKSEHFFDVSRPFFRFLGGYFDVWTIFLV